MFENNSKNPHEALSFGYENSQITKIETRIKVKLNNQIQEIVIPKNMDVNLAAEAFCDHNKVTQQ